MKSETVLDDAETAEIVRLKDEVGLTWRQIVTRLNVKKEKARMRYRRYKARGKAPEAQVSGVTPEDLVPDEDEVFERAVRLWERTEKLIQKRNAQTLTFAHGPVAFAFLADQHMGGSGVNYPRVFGEAELVKDTPGMNVCLVGDLVDNFVIGKLTRLRMDTRLNIADEIVLLKKYVRILAPKILLNVGGNHEKWTQLLTGIPYFRDVIAEVAPNALYDSHQMDVTIKIGKAEYPGRIRHKWKGFSIYNATHGVERGYKWDTPFLWGVAAHSHESGLIREFNARGQTGIAALCGSYKFYDDFARQGGYPVSNDSTAVVIVFTERNGMLGFSNLQMAVEFMRTKYNV